MIPLLPATKDKLFHPLESKWGNTSNNRGLQEQSIKNMVSPNRPHSQETKRTFSALIDIQTNRYLQNRDRRTFPDEMFFHSKVSVFWHQTLQEISSCFNKTYWSWDFTYSKNKEKETFSLAPWDVQVSPGGQSLGLWLGSVLVLTSSPRGLCPIQSRALPEAEFVGKDVVASLMGFSFLPSPCAQPSVLQSDTEGRHSKEEIKWIKIITVPELFDTQREMQMLGMQRDFWPSPLSKPQAGPGIEERPHSASGPTSISTAIALSLADNILQN